MDMNTGDYKLLISLEDLHKQFGRGTNVENEKIVINHINFNIDGSQFVFLLRWFSHDAPWPTQTIVADKDGNNIRKVFGFGSHLNWLDEYNLIITGHEGSDKESRKPITLYFLNTETAHSYPMDPIFFQGDGHCLFSPDKKFVLYDSYTSTDFPYRKLQIYDLERKKGTILAYLYSDPALYNHIVDCRCDLHARWSPDGKRITIDSIHEGYRGIYEIDAEEAIKAIDSDFDTLSEDEINKLLSSINAGQPTYESSKNFEQLEHRNKVWRIRWDRFNKYSLKRKIWVAVKFVSKKIGIHVLLKPMARRTRQFLDISER
jgi:Tol biopolymer transport system component